MQLHTNRKVAYKRDIVRVAIAFCEPHLKHHDAQDRS